MSEIAARTGFDLDYYMSDIAYDSSGSIDSLKIAVTVPDFPSQPETVRPSSPNFPSTALNTAEMSLTNRISISPEEIHQKADITLPSNSFKCERCPKTFLQECLLRWVYIGACRTFWRADTSAKQTYACTRKAFEMSNLLQLAVRRRGSEQRLESAFLGSP